MILQVLSICRINTRHEAVITTENIYQVDRFATPYLWRVECQACGEVYDKHLSPGQSLADLWVTLRETRSDVLAPLPVVLSSADPKIIHEHNGAVVAVRVGDSLWESAE